MKKLLQQVTSDLEKPAIKRAAKISLVLATIFATVFSNLLFVFFTLAQETDNVPRPLATTFLSPDKNPENFFLPALEQDSAIREEQIITDDKSGLSVFEWRASSSEEMQKIIEPVGKNIKGTIYVPYRLYSGKGDYRIEFKSGRGSQSIFIDPTKFDYKLEELAEDLTFDLATVSARFQYDFSIRASVQATPEPTPIPQNTDEPTTASPSPVILPELSPSPTFEIPTPIPEIQPSAIPEITPTQEPPIPEPTPAEAHVPVEPESIASASLEGPISRGIFEKISGFFSRDAMAQNISRDWRDVEIQEPAISFKLEEDKISIYHSGKIEIDKHIYEAKVEIKIGVDEGGILNKWSYEVGESPDSVYENKLDPTRLRVQIDSQLGGSVVNKIKSINDVFEADIEIEKDKARKDKWAKYGTDQENSPIDSAEELPSVEEPTPSDVPQVAPINDPLPQEPAPEETPKNENPIPIPEEPESSPTLEIPPASEPTPEPIPEPGPIEPTPEEPAAEQPVPSDVGDLGTDQQSFELFKLPEIIGKIFGVQYAHAQEEGGFITPSDSAPVSEPAPESVQESVEGSTSDASQQEEAGTPEEQPQPDSAEDQIDFAEFSQEEPSQPQIDESGRSSIDQDLSGFTGIIEDFISEDTDSDPSEGISSGQIDSSDMVAPDVGIFNSSLLTGDINIAASSVSENRFLEQFADDLKKDLANPINIIKERIERDKPFRTKIKMDISDHRGEGLQEFDDKTAVVASYLYHDAESELAPGVVFYADPSFGTTSDSAGLTVQSGDGTKSTDFKIHFNPKYGGAIDGLYLGIDFQNNKVTKPTAGSGALTLIEQNNFSQAEIKSSTLEIIEQSNVRVVVDNIFKLGPEAGVAERWAIYATGRIIKKTIFDKYKEGEERWYLNAAKSGFDLATGYDGAQIIINTKIEPNSKDLMMAWQDPNSIPSASFEALESDDSLITVVRGGRDPWTYTDYQMIDIMQEDLSMVDTGAIDGRVADYRNPDDPEFSVGTFRQVNEGYFSYEMDSAYQKNHVVFEMDGSQIPRFQPVFEIHDWLNPDLGAIRSWLNSLDMVENRDYIVDFRNGDPGTGILVFHFLGTITTNSEFSTDGFATFDIDPEVNPGTGILMYSDGAEVSTSTITTNGVGHSLGAFASVSAGTINPTWVVSAASPIGSSSVSDWDNEHIVANINGTGTLEVLRWNGTSWNLEWTESEVMSAVDGRFVDVEYENSGEAVVVWSSGGTTNEIEYRRWTGTSWTASAAYDPSVNSSAISWIDLVQHPASGSNQNDLGLLYITTLTTTGVGAAVWDGTANSFGNEPTNILESDADEITAAGATHTGAIFYEQSSGDLVAAWGPENAGNCTAGATCRSIIYTTYSAGSWAATASFDFTASANANDGATTLVCAPAPFYLNGTTSKNKAVCGSHTTGSADINGAVWSGTAFGNANANTDTVAGTGNAYRMHVAVGWIMSGSANVGMMVFSSNDTAGVDYEYWDDTAGSWTTDQSLSHTTGGDFNYEFVSNPYKKNTGMIILVDSVFDLYAYEASVSGTTVTLNCLNGACSDGAAIAITQDLSIQVGLPATVVFSNFPNPTQSHFQWLNDSGALNSGTAAAAQDATLTSLAESTIKRLRVQISNEGPATNSFNFQLEFAKKGTSCVEDSGLSAGWTYREIHADAVTASDAFDIENSSNITNGAATTASLSAGDTIFVAGQGIDTQSSTSSITLNGDSYTEVEFALQRNSNAQSSTTYCFRITNGGASTSFSYDQYAQVTTSAAAATSPTYTQDYFRFYVNTDAITPTDAWPSGSIDLAENATMSAHFSSVASGSITRLRTNILVGTATLDASSQSFKLQYAQGYYCGAVSGGSWTDVGASTSNSIWRFGSNAGVTDGTALPDGGTLLSNSDNAARATYEEGNASAVNPNAVSSGQRMEHDWSLQHNGATSGASYCFRIIRNSGTVFETYNRWPLIIIGPNTDQVLRHGAFFSEEVEQPYYWAGI